jgi:probable phosphoglycerate mutase
MTTGASAARVLLVRHGEIEANVKRVWHGSTDSALTERGREQVESVATHLAAVRPAITAVYTSPLMRTRHTAEGIANALGLSPQPVPALVEFGIGELEGVSYEALRTEHGFFERMMRDPDFAPSGGESVRLVVERVTGALRQLASSHPGEEIVAVGHGAALGLALAWLLHESHASWPRYQMSNCSVSELVLEPTPSLVSFDDTSHLQP